MSMATRWRRIDAEHWVHVLLKVATTLWALVTAWTFLVGLFGGLAVMAIVPGCLALASGWLTTAWRRERPWAWWVAATLGGLGFLMYLGNLLIGGSAWWLVGVLLTGALLLLLSHPASRARHPAGARRRRDPTVSRAAAVARPW